jgi:hypothetical protein
MPDAFPRWPPDWIDDHDLAAEEVLVQNEDVSLATALRNDDRVLFSVSWAGGRRYMLVDPIGNDAPRALRVGERAEDADVARIVEGLWSQALAEPEPPRRRRWGRG